MPEPNRRVRPGTLVALLALVAAAASLAGIAAGVRLVTQGDSAPPTAQVLVSDTGVTHGYLRPVLPASPAPAVGQPKPAPSQSTKPLPPRRHHRGPKKPLPPRRHSGSRFHRPARPQRAHHSKQAQVNQRSRILAFMLLDHAVLDMRAAGASPKLLDFMNQPQNLVSTPVGKPRPLPHATRIQVFNSYARIAQAIANHGIAANTKAVVYDNERFTGTPAAELEDPVRYCKLTAKLLHQNGLKYIASPGFDLSGRRPANGQWFRQFVRAGLMKCARHANYLDVQDQLKQGTTTYTRDAHEAAAVLHRINPRAKLLMGLSTSPSGRLATAGQLWRAYQDTSRFVNGYWLNVPRNVSGHSRPFVALRFLHNVVTRTH